MHRLSDTQAEGPANSLRLVRNLSEGDSLSLPLPLSLFLSECRSLRIITKRDISETGESKNARDPRVESP